MHNTGFIARRYLFSKKHISLISTLTAISITGVTIGTALLIVVLSVFNGFFDVIKGLLLSHDPDIRIESAAKNSFIYDEEMLNEIRQLPEVRVISPFVVGKALLAHGEARNKVISVKGVTESKLHELSNMQENITGGVLDLGVRDRSPGLILPEQLSRNLDIRVGDRLALLSADGMRKVLTQFTFPRSYRFEVRGMYSVQRIMGEMETYIDLEAAQRLFNLRDGISGLDLRLSDDEQATRVKEQLQQRLGEEYKISTWYDLQRPLYDVMRMEKWGSYLILMIIVLVAVLNIIGSLTMIVIQKNRDIGVLLTMGYTPADIKKIFTKQGFYIGMIGCGLGGGIGLLLSWLQKEYGLIKLSSAFIIDAYPASINFVDVGIVLVGSLLLCMLASWYPASRASSIDPADAVRYE